VLDVTAKRSSDSKTLVLQVMNLSEQSIPSTIVLDGFKVSKPVSTAQELAGPLDTVNTAQEPDALVLREIDWPNNFTNGSTSYTFKPYSLTVLSFR
jgi:alpha-L-arabinofuranosidase